MTALAHGGAVGLAFEIGAAAAMALLLAWAVWKGRHGDHDDEGRP
jgi:hypothetical protein